MLYLKWAPHTSKFHNRAGTEYIQANLSLKLMITLYCNNTIITYTVGLGSVANNKLKKFK